MKKIFLEKNDSNYNKYWPINQCNSINLDLLNLWESFDQLSDWIELNKDKAGWVTIWSKWDIKICPYKKIEDPLETEAYYQTYDQYYNKRYAEIQKLTITQQNYDELIVQWKIINKEMKTRYVIFVQDDAGVVSFELKDELSQDDQAYIKQDVEKANNFRKKYEAYLLARGPRSEEWNGPEDSEFDSDFLTPEEMSWLPKKK